MNVSTTARKKISEALALVIDAANEARFVPNIYYVTKAAQKRMRAGCVRTYPAMR